MKKGLLFEKISKYTLYYLCTLCLMLGYWGFVNIYYSSFPIFKFSILDWASALGIFSSIYFKMEEVRCELLTLLNIK